MANKPGGPQGPGNDREKKDPVVPEEVTTEVQTEVSTEVAGEVRASETATQLPSVAEVTEAVRDLLAEVGFSPDGIKGNQTEGVGEYIIGKKQFPPRRSIIGANYDGVHFIRTKASDLSPDQSLAARTYAARRGEEAADVGFDPLRYTRGPQEIGNGPNLTAAFDPDADISQLSAEDLAVRYGVDLDVAHGFREALGLQSFQELMAGLPAVARSYISQLRAEMASVTDAVRMPDHSSLINHLPKEIQTPPVDLTPLLIDNSLFSFLPDDGVKFTGSNQVADKILLDRATEQAFETLVEAREGNDNDNEFNVDTFVIDLGPPVQLLLFGMLMENFSLLDDEKNKYSVEAIEAELEVADSVGLEGMLRMAIELYLDDRYNK